MLWIYFVYHEVVTEFGSAADAKEILALVPEFLMGQSLWDRLQRLSLVAVALTTFLDLAYVIAGDGGAVAAVASSFALPLVYMNLLFYMQGFEETGVLVSSKAVNLKPRSKSPSPPHRLPPPSPSS